MYSYISGKLKAKHEDSVVIDAGGIGYELFVSIRALEAVGNIDDVVLLHTYLNVKEDSMTLYGFKTENEKMMFKKIIGVSGIGPKTALNVLSVMSTTDLAVALVTEDVNSLTRVPGIGKKTALRMILELKEKVDNEELKIAAPQSPQGAPSLTRDAIQALMALGFSSSEASSAVRNAAADCNTVEELITAALKTRP